MFWRFTNALQTLNQSFSEFVNVQLPTLVLIDAVEDFSQLLLCGFLLVLVLNLGHEFLELLEVNHTISVNVSDIDPLNGYFLCILFIKLTAANHTLYLFHRLSLFVFQRLLLFK